MDPARAEDGSGLVERVRFVFSGRIDAPSFIAFARHRAARLDLVLDLSESAAATAVAVAAPAEPPPVRTRSATCPVPASRSAADAGYPGPIVSCVMTVRGAPALVDAFEMACSLGPLDCIVSTVDRQRLE